jgi:hypothetical protein
LLSVPAGPASASSGACTGNVCIWVQNEFKGSNHILSIKVYNSTNGGTQTMRWLLNQQVQASYTGDQHVGKTWYFTNYYAPHLACIQGGIVNEARTPCWVVP